MIGHAGQAPNPGDYFTGTIADINYVVVRGEDNQLRAFHNVGSGSNLALGPCMPRPEPSADALNDSMPACLGGTAAAWLIL